MVVGQYPPERSHHSLKEQLQPGAEISVPRSTVKFAEDCEVWSQDGSCEKKVFTIYHLCENSLMLFDVFVLVLASQFMSISDDLWPWEWTWAEPTKEPGPTEGPPGASSDDDVTEVEEVGMRWIIKGPPRWINLYPVKPETIGDRLRQCHGYKCLQAPSGCLALFSYRYSILVLDSLHESLHITYPMILSCPRWWFQQSPSAVVEFQLKPCATRLASTRAEKHFKTFP